MAWYQAGVSEADPVRFLNYLEASVRQVVPLVPAGWDSVDKAAAALESVPLPPLLIVVDDDAHTILSTAAEAALEAARRLLAERSTLWSWPAGTLLRST